MDESCIPYYYTNPKIAISQISLRRRSVIVANCSLVGQRRSAGIHLRSFEHGPILFNLPGPATLPTGATVADR